MTESSEASIEFLRFLADIYESGTGEIIPAKLATWLGLSKADLENMMLNRQRHISWPHFADQLLEILDAIQDKTRNLSETIRWFGNERLPAFDMKTARELVAMGQVRSLLRFIRARDDVLTTQGPK